MAKRSSQAQQKSRNRARHGHVTGPRLTRHQLRQFLRSEPLAVEASVTVGEAPQAAVVGIVVTGRFEVFFDTRSGSRKMQNLRRNKHVALVIGGLLPGDERTAQVEGVADEPSGADLERLLRVYFRRFPDSREHRKWPDIAYVRVRPTWIRYSDYNRDPPLIEEFSF